MADVQQQLTDSQSGTVGFCPTTVASCDAASLLLCLLQRMADVQQQLTESQSGNAQLQAEEVQLQQRLASQQSDLASVSSRLEEEQRFRSDAQAQLQTVS
jgi:regulator of replication initiation timing